MKNEKYKSPKISGTKDYRRTKAMLAETYDERTLEEMKETMTITVFGGKQVVKNDTIILETGTKYHVHSVVINYAEVNVMIKDMLKPRIESMDLILE